jgi:hypothetical protein
MYVTRRLRLRYIWIDSRCFIQDSEKDWERESSEMDFVYQMSHFNIAASSAKDGQGGLFFDRNPLIGSRATLELRGQARFPRD